MAALRLPRSQIRFLQFGDPRQLSEKTDFQRLVAVNRNDDFLAVTGLSENMMAPINPGQLPAARLD